MKHRFTHILCLLAAASALLMTGSCKKYNPFDSYWHGGFEREDTGGKPGKGGLFADGYGTEESPYGLSTPQHMQNIARGLVEGEMVYFVMKNDIDMSNVNWSALNPTDPYKKFIDFDGGGHVITNLYIPKQAYGSFFGVLCGACHDVGFLNAYAESSNGGGIIGGYVGLASPSDGNFTGRVERVYVTGTVRAGGNAGGICGDLGKTADMMPCTISECYSLVEVNGSSNAGGLAGNMRSGSKIENSYSAGRVNGGTSSSGSSTFGAGGLVGNMAGGSITGSIAWNPSLSGMTRGPVYGTKTDGTVSDCYALSTMAGAATANEGVTKKTAAELQTIAGAWGGGWYSDGKVSNGFPILNWQHERGDWGDYSGHGGGEEGGDDYKPSFQGGTGTESDPYLISKLVHLRSMHDTLKANSETWFRLEADIDAKLLNNWAPLNVKDPYDIKIHFDGNNHKISNLRSTGGTYPGFFGVLNGTCKDLTLDNCSVDQSDNSSCGILGGYAGTNGGLTAALSNITLTATCAVTSSGTQPCGGMFGVAANATFTGCTSNATVRSSNGSGNTGDHGCGGLVGKATKTCSFTDCTFGGVCEGSRLVGGILGWTSCQNCTFTRCANKGSVTASKYGSANGQRCGGICGHVEEGTRVIQCYNTGAITAESMAGGITGYLETNNNVLVSRCYSTGNIKSFSNWAGGICAYAISGEISNCWTSGTITAAQQCGAGIVGEIKSGYINETQPNVKGSVINCWTKANINGQRVLGGIAGRCAHDGWNATAAEGSQTASNITISGCIAWNEAITSTDQRTPDVEASSGGIVAYTYIRNTLQNCWRKPGMNYTPSYVQCDFVDQENVSPTAPLTTGTAEKYCYPYHGKAAAASATVSALASSLGWDSSIWTLTGNEPVLK